jgi:hypothetical protein
MNTVNTATATKITQIERQVRTLLGQPHNGAVSAAGGTFNTLCGAVSLRTGAPYELVRQVARPIWDDSSFIERAPSLDQVEAFHDFGAVFR